MLKMQGATYAELREFDTLLTKKEREIVRQIALDGASNIEIANAEYITLGTVKSHIRNILSKAALAFPRLKNIDRTKVALLYREYDLYQDCISYDKLMEKIQESVYKALPAIIDKEIFLVTNTRQKHNV